MKTVIILRGIPGCGKSTWAKTASIGGDWLIVSADNFHIDGDGKYNFQPANAGLAHADCMRRFLLGLQSDENIIVDNTNIYIYDMSPYVMTAKAYGYEHIRLINFLPDLEKSLGRQTHDVPVPVVMKMYADFWPEASRIPIYWGLDIAVV